MKLDVLRSIGHNITDSMASGVSMLTLSYDTDPFGEAAASTSGYIHVDFLNGTVVGENPSAHFARTVLKFHDALSVLCWKHKISPLAFRRLEAKYVSRPLPKRFIVIVESEDGRCANHEYHPSGCRFKVVDELGRIRRKRSPVRSE